MPVRQLSLLLLANLILLVFSAKADTTLQFDSPDGRFRVVCTLANQGERRGIWEKVISLAKGYPEILSDHGRMTSGEEDVPAAPSVFPLKYVWAANGNSFYFVDAFQRKDGSFLLTWKPSRLTSEPRGSAQIPRFEEYGFEEIPARSEMSREIKETFRHQMKKEFAASESVTACEWVGDLQLKIQNRLDFFDSTTNSQPPYAYSARWFEFIQVSETGCKIVETGPVTWTVWDPSGHEGTWQDFPWSKSDRLRLAVRFQQADQVAQLLKEGVPPEDSNWDLAGLAIQKKNLKILLLLKQSCVDWDVTKYNLVTRE